jgi:hypothetical protein
MENSYGIGIANRYDLFYVQDDSGDPFETMVKKKAKTQKTKQENQASTAAGTKPLVNSQTNQTGAEKENKSAALNKNQKDDQNTKLAQNSSARAVDGKANGQQRQRNVQGKDSQAFKDSKKDNGEYRFFHFLISRLSSDFFHPFWCFFDT